jgi:3-oxoadipate enol-lactonase
VSMSLLRAKSGDVELAYEVLGDGPPLLLVQGIGYGRRGWGPALELLSEDFCVVAYDNRGFGESDVPSGPYTARQLAEDAVAVLDAVGVGKAHVVGASLGGMISQEVALGWPDRVDRLVLACTTPGGVGSHAMPEQTVALMLEAPALPPDVAMRRFVENALGSTAPQSLVEEIVAYRTANPPDPTGWQAQAAAGAGHDAIDRLGSIAAPTLVLYGDEDAVVDARNADVLAERIPEARVERFENGGHLFFWEQPERFAHLVREFLR